MRNFSLSQLWRQFRLCRPAPAQNPAPAAASAQRRMTQGGGVLFACCSSPRHTLRARAFYQISLHGSGHHVDAR